MSEIGPLARKLAFCSWAKRRSLSSSHGRRSAARHRHSLGRVAVEVLWLHMMQMWCESGNAVALALSCRIAGFPFLTDRSTKTFCHHLTPRQHSRLKSAMPSFGIDDRLSFLDAANRSDAVCHGNDASQQDG